MFEALRKSLFWLPPEAAHNLAFSMAKLYLASPERLQKLRGKYAVNAMAKQTHVLGLDFRNPIGLAAGLDKNAELIALWESLGFGFIEVGTVTPKAQVGNPKPRLFRDRKSHSVLNRMGFNNAGMQAVQANIRGFRDRSGSAIPLGINLGKNKDTPQDQALKDYQILARHFCEDGDYFVVNVSSPNTPGLRDLQERDFLLAVASELKPVLQKPLFVKLAADLADDEYLILLDVISESLFDGVILCNTTQSRDNALWAKNLGPGGISGRPLRSRSREMLLLARGRYAKPIISVGGIDSADEVIYRLERGASLVQVYSEFIFSGPQWLSELFTTLATDSK